MDAVDRRILGLLREDASRTYTELGRQVSLSAAAVHERVRKLRASGVLRRYSVELDPVALGLPVLAFVLLDTNGWVRDEVFAAGRSAPRIEEVHCIAGDTNFLLKIRVSDPDELEDVLHQLYRVPGVVRSRTLMVLRRGFERGLQVTEAPVEQVAGERAQRRAPAPPPTRSSSRP